MRRALLSLTPLTLLGLVACDGGEPLRPDSGPPPAEVTYYEHVRPILVENCVGCHTTDGIAPFSLETYEGVSTVADRVEEATRLRIMPPFLADNSGDCNTYENHRGLTDEEIATIGDWVDGGLLEGDPTLAAPEPTPLPSLPSVDVTLEMPDDYQIMEEEDDDYRCFLVEPDIEATTFVTGYDVHPGNTQRVHHVIVYNPPDQASADRAIALDMEDGVAGNGYPCFGGPRVDAPPMVLWAPGAGATRFPRGTGIQMVPGRPQIIQVHYNNLVEDSPNTDRTRIELSTSQTAQMAYIAPLYNLGLNLPPRMQMVESSNTLNLSGILPIAVRIYGSFPHMHTLGRSLRVDVHRASGADECLIDVPRWDFNWQLAYWYDDPITVFPEDSATITCRYNTMSRDETVTWGDGTQDEMCLNFVYVSL